MATVGNTRLTLADASKLMSPDGKVDPVAELLSQTNSILEDAMFVEANQPTSHVVGVRTGLPSVYWRAINEGVPPSKSTTAQVTEPIGMVEAHSYIDETLLKLNGNTTDFRLSEDSAFIESMGQEMTAKMFAGNVSLDPKTYTGFGVRYSASSAGNGQNVLLAGGSGSDNASVYLVGWGKNTVFCTYPKGSKAGLQSHDMGIELVDDPSGNKYRAARTVFQWDCGLVVKDWRYAARIANIDLSDWVGVTGTQALTASTNVLKMMVRALARIPNPNMVKLAFYANRSVAEGLMVQALDKSSNVLSIDDAVNQFGDTVLTLKVMGVPVRIVDALGIAETPIS